MIIDVNNIEVFLAQVPEDRKYPIDKLRNTILQNLPSGFQEVVSSGFIHYVVPLKLYPFGYHVKPNEPLPFISIASQKHFIALYHLGLYAFDDVLSWFVGEYPKFSGAKLDMGKSCIRFKKIDQIPYELIKELCQKITVGMWIDKYEESRKSKQ